MEAIVTSAKHADVKPGTYEVDKIFDDGIAIVIHNGRTVFVDSCDVENWKEISDPCTPSIGMS